jgi:hypothetical protein
MKMTITKTTDWEAVAAVLLQGAFGEVLADASAAEDGRSQDEIAAAPRHWLALVHLRTGTDGRGLHDLDAATATVGQRLSILALSHVTAAIEGGRIALLLDADGLDWLYWRPRPITGPDAMRAALVTGAVPFLPWHNLHDLLAAAEAIATAAPTPMGRNGIAIATDLARIDDRPTEKTLESVR